MEFASISLFAFIFAMLIVVGIHEYGHFITARILGIKVIKFSIGFGPSLFSWKSKKTDIEYSLSAFPLGGYVRMLDEKSKEDLSSYSEKELKKSFNRAPIWKRFLIVFNGPFFNFLLAALIYTVLNISQGKVIQTPIIGAVDGWALEQGLKANDKIISINNQEINSWYEGTLKIASLVGNNSSSFVVLRNNKEIELNLNFSDLTIERNDKNLLLKFGLIPIQNLVKNEIGYIKPNSPADRFGLKLNDIILKIDGNNVEFFHLSSEIIKKQPGKTVELLIQRKGVEKKITVTLDGDLNKGFSNKNQGKLGYSPVFQKKNKEYFEIKDMGLIDSFNEALIDIYKISETTLLFLNKMITGQISPTAISGPVGIAKVAGESAQQGFVPLFAMIAFISINLMILNLLPIPALDGGHLILYIIESIVGQIPEKIEVAISYIGAGLILMLMLFAIGLDLTDLLN